MGRTVIEVPCSCDLATVRQVVETVLANDGYSIYNYNNQMVWKKGTGAMTAMHYINTVYYDGLLVLEGWIQVGLGSVGGDEHDLSGSFVAAIPKKSTLATMRKIEQAVLSMGTPRPPAQASAQTWQQPQGQPASAGDSPQRARFCSSCGTRFPNEEANFCSACGAKRS